MFTSPDTSLPLCLSYLNAYSKTIRVRSKSDTWSLLICLRMFWKEQKKCLWKIRQSDCDCKVVEEEYHYLFMWRECILRELKENSLKEALNINPFSPSCITQFSQLKTTVFMEQIKKLDILENFTLAIFSNLICLINSQVLITKYILLCY